LAQDALQFLLLETRSSAALKAEKIFLRKQLALYLEREAKAAAGDRRYSATYGSTLADFCMAECLDQRRPSPDHSKWWITSAATPTGWPSPIIGSSISKAVK